MTGKHIPAFPYVCDADFEYGTGMTLRDYFAARAMQSLIATWGASNVDDDKWPGDDHLARESYVIADAMLKARSA